MIKLENCPFCDGIAIFKCKSKIQKTDGIGFSFSIGCTRCGTEYPQGGEITLILTDGGSVKYTKDERLDIAAKWNIRTVTSSTPEMPRILLGEVKTVLFNAAEEIKNDT